VGLWLSTDQDLSPASGR